jgi:hypothetical protein
VAEISSGAFKSMSMGSTKHNSAMASANSKFATTKSLMHTTLTAKKRQEQALALEAHLGLRKPDPIVTWLSNSRVFYFTPQVSITRRRHAVASLWLSPDFALCEA